MSDQSQTPNPVKIDKLEAKIHRIETRWALLTGGLGVLTLAIGVMFGIQVVQIPDKIDQAVTNRIGDSTQATIDAAHQSAEVWLSSGVVTGYVHQHYRERDRGMTDRWEIQWPEDHIARVTLLPAIPDAIVVATAISKPNRILTVNTMPQGDYFEVHFDSVSDRGKEHGTPHAELHHARSSFSFLVLPGAETSKHVASPGTP